MHNNQNNHINAKFQIEERRRKVASMLAQSMTETEIAKELGVDQSTISRDIKVLKQLSQRFVYDLAKSDLAYYYKQCLDGIEAVLKKGWEMFNIFLNKPFWISDISQHKKADIANKGACCFNHIIGLPKKDGI